MYLEIKNAIESTGGIVDIKRNKSVMQIFPVGFVELIVAICSQNEKDKIKKEIVKKLKCDGKENNELIEKIEQKPLGKALGDYAKEHGCEVVLGIFDTILSPDKFSSICKILKSVGRLIAKEE